MAERAGQPHLWQVLTPQWRSALARSRQGGQLGRTLLLGGVGVAFWGAIFGIAHRLLQYLRGVEEIGPLLAGKMLSVTMLAFLGILLLSNLVTALSTFFLARDLDMLVSAPLDWLRFYLAKLLETATHSSWMVVLLAIPVLTAFGLVFDGGPLFPFVAAAALLPLLALPAVVGSAATLLLVNVFPARRTRDLLALVAAGAVAGAVLLLRVARPEQLARPEGFRSLVDFIAVLQTPSSPYLPSEWTAQVIMNWLTRVADPLPIALLWTTAAAFVVLGAILHQRYYPGGFSKAQEGGASRGGRGAWERLAQAGLASLSVTRREIVLKDLRVFLRDTTQWSQLILLAVLLIVYVFNIRALPLFSGERVPFSLVIFVLFLNQGLAGFVLAAIAARFVFPALSLEGRQLWLLRSSPLDLRALLWSKYWVGTLPLLVLALGLTAVTSTVLRAPPTMLLISLGTMACFTLANSGLALALGVYYPQFDTENAAQIPTSFGGLVFMMASVALLGLVIAIEASPVATLLFEQQSGRGAALTAPLLASLGAVVAVCLATMVGSLHLAQRRLSALEL